MNMNTCTNLHKKLWYRICNKVMTVNWNKYKCNMLLNFSSFVFRVGIFGRVAIQVLLFSVISF